jgi:hypothetical protein
MNTKKCRPAGGLALAFLFGAVAGCGSNPAQVAVKPSKADFVIEFTSGNGTAPTGMAITPDEGDAFLQVVKDPGSNDNKVVWYSRQNFRIKFVQVDDQTQPLKPGKELGDENRDWNDALSKRGGWEYTLKLRQRTGSEPETVAGKYIVQHVGSGKEFDPILIVRR